MSGPARAAIVGWALRTPLGNQPGEVARRFLAGEQGGRASPRFDQSTYAIRRGAAIQGEPPTTRARRLLRRGALFALDAADEARAQAPAAKGVRLGLFAAVGGLRAQWDDLLPALAEQAPDGSRSWERGLQRVHPFWMLQHLSNNAQALLAAEIDARGEGATFAGALAAADALASAARALDDDAIDAALVIAHDSLFDPETLVELGSRHPGALPGEGAAAVVLMRPGDVGAAALAFVTAASTADGGPLEARAETVSRAAAAALDGRPPMLVDEPGPHGLEAALGALGAALPLVQAIVLGALLRLGPLPPADGLRKSELTVLGLAVGVPGLASAILIEIPEGA